MKLQDVWCFHRLLIDNEERCDSGKDHHTTRESSLSLNILIGVSILCYGGFLLLMSRAAGRIDPLLATFIYNCVAGVLPFIVYFYGRVRGAPMMESTQAGMLYAVLSGVMLSAFSLVLLRIFDKGGVGYTVPLIYGGTIVFTSLVGWLVFKEQIPLLQGIGIVVMLAGMGLVVYSRTVLE